MYQSIKESANSCTQITILNMIHSKGLNSTIMTICSKLREEVQALEREEDEEKANYMTGTIEAYAEFLKRHAPMKLMTAQEMGR